LEVRLGSRLPSPSSRSLPTLPEKQFEKISDPPLLCLLGEGMQQGKLALHLVDVSATNSLASDVAVLD
jgi:hypothetical protein